MASSQGQVEERRQVEVKVSQIYKNYKKRENGGTCETIVFTNLVTIHLSIEYYIYQCLL